LLGREEWEREGDGSYLFQFGCQLNNDIFHEPNGDTLDFIFTTKLSIAKALYLYLRIEA
jgi:hypothetical protein